MNRRKGCILDFDDTLVETTIYFDKAKERFAEKMYSRALFSRSN